MENIFLILIILGFGVSVSTKNIEVDTDSNYEKCLIDENEALEDTDYFCSEEDTTSDAISHQETCTTVGGEVYTCLHGHWSGTDSSVAPLRRKKRFFWKIITVVVCSLFCRRKKRGGGRGGGTTIKYPPSFPEPCKPHDVQSIYTIHNGKDGVIVKWTVPTPTDRDGGTPKVTQVGGGLNGGRFDGATYGKTHYIIYKATDSDGLTGHCYFSFVVIELTCSSLPWPPNGAKTCDNKNILGSSCHYTCNTGYQITGNSTVTCGNEASPSWSAIPTCEKITCSEPSYPEHTTAQCTDPDYGFLSVCSMACNVGYILKGAYFMQCQADGTWSNDGDTSCVDDTPPTISCATPQIFHADHGVTSTSVNWQLPTASDATDDNPSIVQTFGPSPGAVLEVGTKIVKYKAVDEDGSESEECYIVLRVKEITCSHPLDAFTDDYMRFNCSAPSSGYVYGTSCHLSCSAYLPLEGTDLITCEANNQSEGVWSWGSGAKPYCREIACPDLDAPTNGALVHDTILTRPLRIMTCNNQFDIPDMGTNFNGQLFCTDDGDWTPFSEVPDCIEPRNPRFLNLPCEIFYYGGSCGDDATIAEIKSNFQAIIESSLNPYFAIVCPSGETCVAENVVVTCGPIQSRKKKSMSRTIKNHNLHSSEFESYPKDHNIEKRNAESHLLILQFYIVTPMNFTYTTFDDALAYYDDIQLNILKSAVQYLINNGTFDIDNFVLKSDSFATPSYGDIVCDDGYMLDKTTCKPCPVGYVLNRTSNQCEQCPAGQYKEAESDSTCSSCPSGYTTQDSGSKSQASCVKLCSPGTYSANTIEICTSCPVGYYQDEYGQTTCKQCTSGATTASTNSISADDCKVFDACMSSPCNGHNCTCFDDSYVCTCHKGWSGTNCEIPPDHCNGNACENGATCVSDSTTSTNYTCYCAPGYIGPFCEIPPVDGGWAEWTATACSKTCGTGIMNRTRQCDSPVPDANGADCAGDAIETVACNTEACPVCEALTSASGTLFNCSTDETTGSETCTVYCEDGKVLPLGLNNDQSYTCGLNTNFEWDYLENPPSCVDPVGPGNVSISIAIDYTKDIPYDVESNFKDLINDQISGLQCFDSANCQTNIEIKQSTLTIVFTIPTSQGPNLAYSDYLSSGIPNGALQEVIDAINHLEGTAQAIQNNTNELFDVTIDGVTYTVADDSLEIGTGVACDSGFVAYDGICVACPAGTHSIDDICTFCEKGKYQPNTGQTTCKSCPDGQTTNSIGSTDNSQCIESTTSVTVATSTESTTQKRHSDKRSHGNDDDDNVNTVILAITISVLTIVIAVTVIAFLWYKNCRPNTTVTCSTVNIMVEQARISSLRSGRSTRTPFSRGPTTLSDCNSDDYLRSSDDCQTPWPHHNTRSSSALRAITPDNVSIRYCSPPPYEAKRPKFTEKDLPGPSV